MLDTASQHRLRVLEIAEPDCVADDFGGEVVVLNTVSGVYFSLRDLAAALWRDLVVGHPVKSLIAGISSVNEQIAEATVKLIDEFERSGLMRRTSQFEVQLARMAPEAIALVRTGETKLTIESFEDMKDIIVADPIHDTDDQFGWPTLRRTDET